MKIRPFIWLVCSPFLLIALSCMNRKFNAQVKSNDAATSSSGTEKGAAPDASVSLPALVDPALLKDDSKYPASATPPMKYSEDAVYSKVNDLGPFPGPGYFSSVLDANGKAKMWISSSSNLGLSQPTKLTPSGSAISGPLVVTDYEKWRVKAGLTKPVPLAAASVLKILRFNRSQFAKTREGQVRVEVPPALGLGETFKSEPQAFIDDASKPFTETRCVGYDVPSNSDIKWHYYCAIPAMFRGCQRYLVGRHFDSAMRELSVTALVGDPFLKKMQEVAEKDFEHVTRYCTLQPGGDPQIEKSYDETPTMLSAPYLRKPFAAFYESQVLDIPGVGKVNMYDYIMRSQTYAFDFTQQQAVLNAYYGDMKPAALGPFDPKTECLKYREKRRVMDGNNPCLPDDPRAFFFVSDGR